MSELWEVREERLALIEGSPGLLFMDDLKGKTKQNLKLGIMGPSYHFNRKFTDEQNLNENNVGAYIENGNWVAGGYKNSFNNTALFGARKFPTKYSGIDLFAGAASGYEDTRIGEKTGGVIPMVGASYTKGPFRIMATPSVVNFGMVHKLK